MDQEVEIPLQGGNVTPVVRVGATVRRRQGPWSATVQGLLRHLEAMGFAGAPRFLGIDDQEREILSYIPGEMGHYPLPAYMWSGATLAAVARFIRRYHDVTMGYNPPGAHWQWAAPPGSPAEVICHNDIAPYNMVFAAEQPAALIDFDGAAPGPRAWDLAYAAYRWVPLSYAPEMQERGLAEPARQVERLHAFCAAYGDIEPVAVLAQVIPRLQALCAWLTAGAEAGDPARVRMVVEGHRAFYEAEIAAIRQVRLLHIDI